MTSTLITPENEIFPQRKRWTRRECYRLMEQGELQGRWELIDGEILSKMGQKPPHRIVLNLIAEWLMIVFGNRFVQTQEPITIPGISGKSNEPEPDIAVTLEPTTSYVDRHPSPTDILLIVEVSDASLRFDMHTKALLYARVGIQEYWVADILNRKMYCHSKPSSKGYAVVDVVNDNDQLTLTDHPKASIKLGDLLPTETEL